MDFANAASSLASWEVCMSNAYCKYPVIIGIVVGVIVILTLIFCLFRCMGCCASCCGSCFRCGGGRKKAKSPGQYNGFQPGPPPPVPHLSQNQYHSPQQPVYAQYQPSPYKGSQTATFDAPTKGGRYHEDSLPAMPSWADGKTRHIEDETVEMERLHSASDVQQQQQQQTQPGPHVLSGYDEPASAAEHFNATSYPPVNNAPYGYSQPTQSQPTYAQSGYAPNQAHSAYSQSSPIQSNYATASPYGVQSGQPESHYDIGQAEAQPHAFTTNAHSPNAYTQTAYMPDMPNNDYSNPSQFIASAVPNPARSPPPRSTSATRAGYSPRSISATRSPPPPRSISATRSPPPRDASATRIPQSPRSPSATRAPYQSRSISATRSPPQPQRSFDIPRSTEPFRGPEPVRSAEPLHNAESFSGAQSGRRPSVTKSPPSTADPVRTPPALSGLVRSLSHSTAGHGSVLPLYSQPISPTTEASSPTSFAPSTTVPPSYHIRPGSARSPPPQPPTEYGGFVPRRPVQGSWRDV